MPQILDRRDAVFLHSDSRLRRKVQRPTVVRSLDMTDLFRTHISPGWIRFDYGYDARKLLRVEITIHRALPYMHWRHEHFDVESVRTGRGSESLSRLAESLKITEDHLVSLIAAYAPFQN